MKVLLIAALGLMLGSPLFGKSLQRDLGRGLVYIRASRVPEDLPQHSRAPAIVLDLRYATGDTIKEWLAIYAAPQTPIFVLTNSATQKSLRDSAVGVPGSITLGVPREDFAPDIAINTMSADEEKRVYDAIPETPDIATLLYPATHKERYDEAALIRDHEVSSDILPSKEDDDDTLSDEAAPPQLIDHALLRAVHIHRGWLVLRSR